MQRYEKTGKFWVVNEHGAQQGEVRGGRLTFDPAEGGMLEVGDNFREEDDFSDRKLVVWGKVGFTGLPVTLLHVYALQDGRYIVNQILDGGHFQEAEVFTEAVVRISDLPDWVSAEAINIDVKNAIGEDRRAMSLEVVLPEAQAATFARGTLTLRFTWDYHPVEYGRVTVDQWPQFELAYDEPTPYTTIVDDVGNILDLMSLCVDRLCDVDELYFRRDDLPERSLAGTSFPGTRRRIGFLAGRKQHVPIEERQQRNRVHMLASYDEVGGIDVIARWLDTAPDLHPILGFLSSMRFTNGIYPENRFLNVCSAAEGYHRMLRPKQTYMDPAQFKALLKSLKQLVPDEHRRWFAEATNHANSASLAERLTDMAMAVSDVSTALVGDTSTWVKVVKTVRNELTHLEGGRPHYDGDDLRWLAESVYTITRVYLLLQAGMSMDSVGNIARRGPVWSVRDAIRAAITNVAKQRESHGTA
ncbi:HEPN domain-containing protein [Catellatospora sp. NPDC049111]|uniref:ApeA N-terminal domain 1-containing protein n=1 Tax=Catellatospora sp. NPDC049111 TaxID=3155271 RepID=UPI00340036D0